MKRAQLFRTSVAKSSFLREIKNKQTNKERNAALLNVQANKTNDKIERTANNVLITTFDSFTSTPTNKLQQTARKHPKGPEFEKDPIHASCALSSPMFSNN